MNGASFLDSYRDTGTCLGRSLPESPISPQRLEVLIETRKLIEGGSSQ